MGTPLEDEASIGDCETAALASRARSARQQAGGTALVLNVACGRVCCRREDRCYEAIVFVTEMMTSPDGDRARCRGRRNGTTDGTRLIFGIDADNGNGQSDDFRGRRRPRFRRSTEPVGEMEGERGVVRRRQQDDARDAGLERCGQSVHEKRRDVGAKGIAHHQDLVHAPEVEVMPENA